MSHNKYTDLQSLHEQIRAVKENEQKPVLQNTAVDAVAQKSYAATEQF